MLNEVIETIATVATAVNSAQTAATTTNVIRKFIQNHPIASVVSVAGISGVTTGAVTHAVTINELNKESYANDMKNFFGRSKNNRSKTTAKNKNDTVSADTINNEETNEIVGTDKHDSGDSQAIDKESTEIVDTDTEKANVNEAELSEKTFLSEQFSSALQKISSESVIISQIASISFDSGRYKKIDSKELTEIIGLSINTASSAALSISNAVSVSNVNQFIKDNGGVFKVVFKKGVTDKSIKDLCRNCENLLITAYRDENGFNQAGLLSIDGDISDQLKNVNAASVVNCVMSSLSFVVGSYYLHNIDKSLNDIKKKIDNLTEMIHEEKYASLKSIYESLIEISHKFYSGYLNKEQIASYQNLVVQNRQECGKIVVYYEEQLNKLTEQLDVDCRDRTLFINNINDFNLYMQYYQLAVEVYAIAYDFEVIISENRNDSFLKDSICNIREFVKRCNDNQNIWHKKIDWYIRNVSALNNQWWAEIFSVDKIWHSHWDYHWEKDSGKWINNSGRYSEYTREDLENDIIKNDIIKFDISPLNKNIESLVKYANQDVNLAFYKDELYYIDNNQLNDLETEEN